MGRWEMACNFFVAPTNSVQQICAPEEAVYTLEVSENFTNEVSITITGLPDGATSTLSSNPVNAGDMVTLTIGNTVAATPGTYTITIEGTDGIESTQTDATLTIFNSLPGVAMLESPMDGEEGASIFPTYTWNQLDFADLYDIQVATDADFTSIILDSAGVSGNNIQSMMLEVESTYFWRVRGNNLCGVGEWSTPFSFTTAAIACAPTISGDIPVDISSDGTPTIVSTIEITTPGTAVDIKVVNLNIDHTWVGDLFVTLTSPMSTEVILFDRPGVPAGAFGCGNNNAELGFDDFATNTAEDLEGTCNDDPLALSGVYQPVTPLASFAGEPVAGTWTLTITDNADQDGGSLIGWALDICATIPSEASIVLLEHEEEVCTEAGISGELILGTGFTEDVTLSMEGLPNDVTVEWSENPAAPGATVTFNVIGSLPAGNLDLSAVATTTDVTFPYPFSVNVIGAPAAFDLVSPANNSTDQPAGLLLNWDASAGASDYNLIVATDPGLTEVIFSGAVSGSPYNLSGLDLSTTYYWQVEANNECGSTQSEVFNFSTLLDLSMNVTPQTLTICQSAAGAFELIVGEDFGDERNYSLSVSPDSPLGASFMVNQNNPSVVTATLTNTEMTSPGIYSLDFMIEDNDGNNASVGAILTVEGPPNFTTLLTPANGLTILDQSPDMDWSTVNDVTGYTIEIADSDLFTNILETAEVGLSSYSVTSVLEAGTYYWRVTTTNECGSSVSGAFSFVVSTSNIRELNGRKVDFLPNPTNDLVNVLFSEALSGELVVEVFSVNGQQLQRLQFDRPAQNVEIDLASYASGVYLIRLVNEEASLSKRVILQK